MNNVGKWYPMSSCNPAYGGHGYRTGNSATIGDAPAPSGRAGAPRVGRGGCAGGRGGAASRKSPVPPASAGKRSTRACASWRRARRSPGGRIRQPGGGRKRAEDRQQGLLAAFATLWAPGTRGDPRSPVRWTSKSGEKIAEALRAQGFAVCGNTVRRLLKALDSSL
jgi:hypothetical protein